MKVCLEKNRVYRCCAGKCECHSSDVLSAGATADAFPAPDITAVAKSSNAAATATVATSAVATIATATIATANAATATAANYIATAPACANVSVNPVSIRRGHANRNELHDAGCNHQRQ